MTLITLTHANTHREIVVVKEQIFAVQYSEAHKATHIISTGEAIVPVAENVSVVKDAINGPTAKGDGTNGT